MTAAAERRGLRLLARGETWTLDGPAWVEKRGMVGLVSFDFTFTLVHRLGSVGGGCLER